MKNATVSARVEFNLKNEAEEILEQLGICMTGLANENGLLY